jgi:hypothetical protein
MYQKVLVIFLALVLILFDTATMIVETKTSDLMYQKCIKKVLVIFTVLVLILFDTTTIIVP